MKTNKNDKIIKSAFATLNQPIKTSDALDYKILTMAYNYEKKTSPTFHFWGILKKSVITVLAFFVVFVGYNTYQEVVFKQQCLTTYQKMMTAVENKNINQSLAFYDFSDFNTSPETMKKNIETLYNSFENFKYDIHNIKIKIKGNEAVGTSQYSFSAFNNGKKVLTYNGQDRIYFKKNKNTIKIYAWISK